MRAGYLLDDTDCPSQPSGRLWEQKVPLCLLLSGFVPCFLAENGKFDLWIATCRTQKGSAAGSRCSLNDPAFEFYSLQSSAKCRQERGKQISNCLLPLRCCDLSKWEMQTPRGHARFNLLYTNSSSDNRNPSLADSKIAEMVILWSRSHVTNIHVQKTNLANFLYYRASPPSRQ